MMKNRKFQRRNLEVNKGTQMMIMMTIRNNNLGNKSKPRNQRNKQIVIKMRSGNMIPQLLRRRAALEIDD